MTHFSRSLRLIVCVGAGMLGNPSEASSAEPAKTSPNPSAPSAVSKALAQPPGQARTESLRAAIQAWGSTDPQAALAWALVSTKDFEQYQLVDAILWVWARREPAAAATYALGLPAEKRARWEVLRHVVMGWSRTDPRATLAWVQKLAPGIEQSDLLNLTVSGWASCEPEAAAAFALGYPPGRDRLFFVRSALEGWLDKEPAAAWAFAQSLSSDVFPTGMSKPAVLDDLLKKWGDRDPAAALDHVGELPDPTKRRSKQDWLIRRLAEKDRDNALEHARKLTGVERDSALYQVAEQQAERDPRYAAAVAAEISSGDYKQYVGEMLAGGLGKIAISTMEKNPTEAVKLLGQMPKGRQRSNAVLFVALELAKRDPRAAIALADAYPEAEESEGLRANILPVWAMRDFDGAVAWARQLPAGVSRDQIASRLADQWAERNPREAIVFMQSLADPNSRRDFQFRLAERWAATDPTGARAAAAGLTAGKMRDEFVDDLIVQLATKSPRDAADLVTTLSSGLDQIRAVDRVLPAWLSVDRPAAEVWAASLPAGPTRDHAEALLRNESLHLRPNTDSRKPK